MDPYETLIQYVKSLGKELCIKTDFDIGNGLAVKYLKSLGVISAINNGLGCKDNTRQRTLYIKKILI